MKKTVESLAKTMICVAALGSACFGCVSYPFIDESIAKLDANPVPIIQRFNLPEVPLLPIAPQSADLLVGDWMTGFQKLVCREVGQDGLIHDFPENHKNAGEVYGFNVDGSYGHNDIYQWGAMLMQLKKFGKWSYDSGVLTLKCEKMRMRVQDFLAKEAGAPNWDQEFPLTMNEPTITTYRVDWYAYNEIAITANDETPPPLTGSREDVRVDVQGVRTKREIKVLGMREGRETGTVEETTYPPMRFKKKENAE